MDKSALKRCLLGFGLLLVTPFAGSMAWIIRLLGCIGLANGMAHGHNLWFTLGHRLSILAVVLCAFLEIARLTGLVAYPTGINLILPLPLAVCLLMGLRKHNQEETK